MSTTDPPLTAPLLRRSLAAVYRFYDIFYLPFDGAVPPVRSPLAVSIPSLRWHALWAENDATYRFSALTLTKSAPIATQMAVEVVAQNGDYVNHEPIKLDLPLPLSTPPRSDDFLLCRALWPTTAFRPPPGETAVRGQICGAGALGGLRVVMAEGATPPLDGDGPYTFTDARGEFLFRFPRQKGPPRDNITLHIQVSEGGLPVAITPATVSAVYGTTNLCQFQRT